MIEHTFCGIECDACAEDAAVGWREQLLANLRSPLLPPLLDEPAMKQSVRDAIEERERYFASEARPCYLCSRPRGMHPSPDCGRHRTGAEP